MLKFCEIRESTVTRIRALIKGDKMKTTLTRAQVRALFWETFPELPRKKITDYSGTGKMHCTDTRCAFADFVDSLHRAGQISDKTADEITL
jgi:hypothetical protein